MAIHRLNQVLRARALTRFLYFDVSVSTAVGRIRHLLKTDETKGRGMNYYYVICVSSALRLILFRTAGSQHET